MVPFLILLGAIALYLVGYLNGRAERDQRDAELMRDEQHARHVAEDQLRAWMGHATSVLMTMELRNQALQSEVDHLQMTLYRREQPRRTYAAR